MRQKGGQRAVETLHAVGEARRRRNGHLFGQRRLLALLGGVDEDAAALQLLLEGGDKPKPLLQTVEPHIAADRNGDQLACVDNLNISNVVDGNQF